MDLKSKIFVAGHRGLVGSAVVRQLKALGYDNLVLKNRSELDLLDAKSVEAFFADEQPEYVIDCAAKVGGLKAKIAYPAEFLYENLQLQNNIIWNAKNHGVSKFLFIGSSVVYPQNCEQPMREEHVLEGEPEAVNEAYAISKICGIKLCEYINKEYKRTFMSCLPTNIYGVNDNFDPESSHVIPSLIRRIYEAKEQSLQEVVIWGSGEGRREFLYVDDLAEAICFLMTDYDDPQFINIGTGEDFSISELAYMLKAIIGYEGRLVFDTTKPDGMPKKLLDVSRINNLGWKHKTSLEEGLHKTYEFFVNQVR